MGSARRVWGGFGSFDVHVDHPLTACMVNDSDLGLRQLAMGDLEEGRTTEEELAAGKNEELNETPDETLARWEEEGNPAAGELRRALGRMELGDHEVNDDVSGETPEETLARWVEERNPAAEELRRCLEEGREAARMVAGRRKRRGDGTSGSDWRAKEARRDPLLRYCRSCGGCFGGTAVCEAPHCWVKGGTLQDTSVGRGED